MLIRGPGKTARDLIGELLEFRQPKYPGTEKIQSAVSRKDRQALDARAEARHVKLHEESDRSRSQGQRPQLRQVRLLQSGPADALIQRPSQQRELDPSRDARRDC